MKEDEKQFLIDIFTRCRSLHRNKNTCLTPRNLINESSFYMHHKRAWYLLEKWSNKGWYDYGVSVDLGWLTLTDIEMENIKMGV